MNKRENIITYLMNTYYLSLHIATRAWWFIQHEDMEGLYDTVGEDVIHEILQHLVTTDK